MSKIGRRPVEVPRGVTVQQESGTIIVRGPKGEIRRPLSPGVTVTIEETRTLVSSAVVGPSGRAIHGLMRSLLASMVTGVTAGYRRVLEVNGLGYRAEVTGRALTLHVGLTHPVTIELPLGVEAKVEKQGLITLESVDKALMGQTAARIRAIKPPEPYKGTGIRYTDEHVRRKAGKAGKAATA